MNDSFEIVILSQLLHNDPYCRKVLPYLKPEFFNDYSRRFVFELIKEFITTYTNLPTKEALIIQCNDKGSNLTEEQYSEITEIVSVLDSISDQDLDWLVDKTEIFCKDRSLDNALIKSVEISEGLNTSISAGQIPSILTEALSLSFDPSIGHDYFLDASARHGSYTEKKEKFPFDIDLLNKITRGGVEKGTLNVILAGTNVGKTAIMCHFASAYLLQGHNVLYITLEMGDTKISQRVDANLLNISMDDFERISKHDFMGRIEKLQAKTSGKFIVKNYPTSSASTLNFTHLMDELKMKAKFKPDIVFIDYLNIAASHRNKDVGNSYNYIKCVAEEIRAFSQQYEVPVWSATQTNRQGFGSNDIELGHTSESFGLPATADFMVAVMSDENMKDLNQMRFKQLKSRYGDTNFYRNFIVGCDFTKMRLYDVESDAQLYVNDSKKKVDDKPAFDNTPFGEGMKAEKKNKLKGLKFS